MSKKEQGRRLTTFISVQGYRLMLAGYYISIHQLKIDPGPDPIRNDSGFQRLLVEKEQIGLNR